MTATLSETKTATPAERPVEFVLSLPVEQRLAVLFALLREVYKSEGDFAAIPLRDGDTDLGYLARTEEMLAGCQKILVALPRDVAAHMCEPLPDDFDPDDCLTEADLKALHRELDAQYAARSPVAS